ncbi:MAG: hypothetical protein R3B36_00310 [Polyangiaceae bacterium]
MAGCVSPQALLSALAQRAVEGGRAPSREEIASLRALGCSRDEIEARFAEAPADARAIVTELLNEA